MAEAGQLATAAMKLLKIKVKTARRWRMLPKLDRPDILAADEAQPVETLAILELPWRRVHARFFPKLILDSVPSNRRRMLTVWRRITSNAITSTTAMGSASRRPASHA